MREHQIIITLKPDQFLQVQRLARMAGAKSMGMFVRQRLLAALGIEGEIEREGRGRVDLQPAVSELRRLHSELRGFVAESLAMYLDSDVSDTTAVGSDPDPMFAARSPNHEQPPATNGVNDQAYAQDEAASSDVDSIAVVSDSPTEVTVEPVIRDDELEKLADRTFAISPRLGAIEPVAPAPVFRPIVPATISGASLRDPLGELLEGADLPDDEANFIDEEESFTIPLAIQERRRQIAEQQQENAEESAPKAEMQPAVVRPARVSVPEHTLRNDVSEADPDDDQQVQTQSGAESQTSGPTKGAPDAGSLGNQGGNPISGGPPPKRRKS
ncbi:MAG: hypothetical protein K2W95_36595 [Candidatus Obscuribacterales bacterium]|nr:hypothetical protein [Candidatus Obscuribacterales bacterium]